MIENKDGDTTVVENTKPMTGVDSTNTNVEPNNTNVEPKEIVFDELDDNIKKFIDRERTKASKTAREHALKDPKIREKLRSELEAEAKLTAEQKLQIEMEKVSRKTNELTAREYLMKNGNLSGDDLDTALTFVVSTDEAETLSKVESYVTSLQKIINSATEKKVQEIMKSQPKPKTQKTVTKAFKDMNYNERLELKQADPSRYKAEMDKIKTRI